MNGTRTGRRILLAVAVVVVALAALVGFFVGSNASDVSATVRVAGLFALPVTPTTMAGYAAGLAAVVLGALFGLVVLASRYDEAGA